MATTPRNPRYFPRMKVRGARRRKLAPAQRVAGSFDRFGVSARFAAQQMHLLAAALNRPTGRTYDTPKPSERPHSA